MLRVGVRSVSSRRLDEGQAEGWTKAVHFATSRKNISGQRDSFCGKKLKLRNILKHIWS